MEGVRTETGLGPHEREGGRHGSQGLPSEKGLLRPSAGGGPGGQEGLRARRRGILGEGLWRGGPPATLREVLKNEEPSSVLGHFFFLCALIPQIYIGCHLLGSFHI